jgi:biopolymer transport protein ExbB
MFRTILKLFTALTVASLVSVSPVSLSVMSLSMIPVALAQQPAAAPKPSAPSTATAMPLAQPQAITAGTETPAAAPEGAVRSLKAAMPGLHELSPWSMFLSADIVVKGVIIGLVFASLVTWTVLIAKTIELSALKGRLRKALRKAAEARSLADAQLSLGAKDSVLSSLLNAAMREARMSAGISSDSGIKERAASSFAEITRAEARRIRIGMGLLATIGATAPFVGLFGTVWGIMNSFIGISKSQTTNLAVVAPGIAEALLATAVGLAAAIPAVIIYNHFSRVTKAYLELVSRSSGAAARLLSRDLDRSHGAAHVRAAE